MSNHQRTSARDSRKDYRILILLAVGLFIALASLLENGKETNQLVPEELTVLVSSSEKFSEKMGPFLFLPINLNSADTKSLQAIPGIGPALSEKIVILRNSKNGFKDFSDLLEVEGIGPGKMDLLQKNCTL